MIKIVAKSVIKTEQVENYLTLAKELIDKSRKEEGCISYGLFQDINDISIFTFIEEWKDEKAINLHNNSEHFTRIVPLLGELRVGNGEVNLYKEIIPTTSS
ncbi:putative quinol monooxygenase [Clostridium beijerinckii]|uniref:putative quinol monooxygenase n=1 Tax=Clostridium beijerinckii TaxID=1520 RepID=UPI001494F762|nr:putative quinol monooxygenase [Clostridium beijerinckii]NOW06259.1 quinol monooxygenase YgiN [Clostridium beijerinckii]NYC00597.1 quinol monooxygenase YgiN [Clostridium beijerinckii]